MILVEAGGGVAQSLSLARTRFVYEHSNTQDKCDQMGRMVIAGPLRTLVDLGMTNSIDCRRISILTRSGVKNRDNDC